MGNNKKEKHGVGEGGYDNYYLLKSSQMETDILFGEYDKKFGKGNRAMVSGIRLALEEQARFCIAKAKAHSLAAYRRDTTDSDVATHLVSAWIYLEDALKLSSKGEISSFIRPLGKITLERVGDGTVGLWRAEESALVEFVSLSDAIYNYIEKGGEMKLDYFEAPETYFKEFLSQEYDDNVSLRVSLTAVACNLVLASLCYYTTKGLSEIGDGKPIEDWLSHIECILTAITKPERDSAPWANKAYEKLAVRVNEIKEQHNKNITSLNALS